MQVWLRRRTQLLSDVEGYVFQLYSIIPERKRKTTISYKDPRLKKLERTQEKNSCSVLHWQNPQEEVQRVKVPDVELVVKRSTASDAC